MKKRVMIFGMVLVVAVILNSCYKDIVSPDLESSYPPQQVSFKNDLAPYLKKTCSSNEGCHNAGSHEPYMDDVTKSFKNIVTNGYVNTTFPKQSKFYKFVYGEMSEYSTKSERTKIYDWIRTGAKNN
ncbi:MAG: hypothetical protein IPK88_19105 [Saprospiraceae bacterium]|jgi:hypothetical protein|uniref:Cytochrome c domain-containing protein n=1 Tax=Candidatus Defluviibacterium haderslevense TaxID=2981993 RepID=A0A9D7S929_9BACT|nr:hypothetical protein [Candidatus Defluviibacterium haderslevense]MCC7027952.1 hypothetical protein [Saprospiraceae bacterium]MBK7244205.1 hypothetical protein [Candidatus Defluviibacterium haderslevense]MBK8245544.1 hypothetical protein [Candidatus Defluviibacterium haderslevense]MBK9718008.1 hypothetical protein [Candidatus Defluviibacterium haderslevense]